MAELKVDINIDEIAQKLNQTREAIEQKVIPAVEKLSIAAHAFIINKANQELSDFKRNYFLGLGKYGDKTTKTSDNNPGVDQTAKNVRWTKAANGIWVVEIDEKAAWIENGRSAVSMATEDWLLKPGKTKTAKDGSSYRSIPFEITKGNKPAPNVKPAYESIVKNAMKEQKIHRTRIETNTDGSPKIGVIHKLNIRGPEGGWAQYPAMHSKPRTAEESAMSGLKPHGGIFHLQGAVVVQRMQKGKGGKEKAVKETVVFRTVSSKHKAEDRWMSPAVEPFGAIPAAKRWAEDQLKLILKDIEREFEGI